MKKYISFLSVITLGLCPILSAEERPNILFLFCDDLGFGDVGVFYQNSRKRSEARFSTPHIDQLAKDGMQLHAHYVGAPVCAPSRATLFLGQSQGNAPVRDNQFDKALPDQPTLASTLKNAGYSTALIGKWGLQGSKKSKNQKKDAPKTPDNWPSYPTKRGFDYFLGGVTHVAGHEHYPFDRVHFKHSKKKGEIWEQNKEITADLKGCYTTDLFTAATKKYLIDHSKNSADKPFFIMLSYDTPHAATQIATMKYPKGFGVNGGIQWVGKPGKMINTVSDKVDNYIHPDYANEDWKEVSKRYASSIRRIDNSVADIVQTLKDLKLEENTLVVFSSDHGPSQESYIKQGLDPSFFQSFGEFTGIKRDCWEGGIRPGAIAKWPAKIKAGTITQTPSQMQDWMPTFCDIAGVSAPALTDGISIIPTLTGAEGQKMNPIYVEYVNNSKTPNYQQYPKDRAGSKRGQMQSIRIGDFKAIRYNIQSAKDPFLVFNVVKDPSESTDIASKSGTPSQEYWHAVASREHHANPSAKRPYDGATVAGLKEDGLKSGTLVTQAKSDAPKSYLSQDSHKIQGYLKVDQAGNHTFSFSNGTKGILRVHNINALDTSSKEVYPNDNTLNLGKGYHPFTLYLEKKAEVTEVLQWKTSSIKEATSIPADRFFQ